MVTPGQRATWTSLNLDAYTADEMGPPNTAANIDPHLPREIARLRKNRFTEVRGVGNAVTEHPLNLVEAYANQANPRINPSLRVKQTNIPDPEPKHRCWLYVSPAVVAYKASLAGRPWTTPIRVSVLYGVGTEVNRHGLRSFFESDDVLRALVLVPGVEPQTPKDPRFGIGIRDIEIRTMLQTVLGRDVTFEVRVMAAFSTGINGLNQTLLNDLVAVSALERIVIYDCLYTLSSGATATALAGAKQRCGSRLRLVAYKCSGNFDVAKGTSVGGNSFKPDGRLSVVADNPGLFSADGIVANLYYSPAYSALITFRSLEGGLADGSVTLAPGSTLAKAFADMVAVVPKRGTMLSSKATFAYVFGTSSTPAGKVWFDEWAATNKDVISAFVKQLGSVSRAGSIRNLVWGNFLPGWVGGDGEENHDLLLPDFGHEYLPA